MCTIYQPRAMYTSSRDKALGVRLFVTLMFDNGLYRTVPYTQDCAEWDWKPQTSCKRHFELHGSIPCQMQKSLLVCGIHPVLVYHINTDNQCCRKPQQISLVSLIYATYIRRINYPQAFKLTTLKLKIKCIYLF
jgi:hypothetical protein